MLFQSPPQGSPPPVGVTAGDEAITDILAKKPRTFSAEVIPPRNGAETAQIMAQLQAMKDAGVDFISVTKGAGGSLRGGTLPIAQLIKQNYKIGSLAHFTCRDYTVAEVENALMDHHYFGIRNILALRGDPPDGQLGAFVPSPDRHTYAYQLVEQIAAMNDGRYLVREGFDVTATPGAGRYSKPGQNTQFCIGVAVYPEDEPLAQAVEFFRLKAQAGARFGITQMLYSAEAYARFMDASAAQGAAIPVLPGLRVITAQATAERMMKKFGVKVPTELLRLLAKHAASKDDSKKAGLEFTIALCERLLKAGAPGIHVFIMNDEQTGAALIRSLS